MNARAQESWKDAYRYWRAKFAVGGKLRAYSTMQRYRREAALERKLEAAQRTIEAQAQRTIEAQAQRVAELESYIDAHNRKALSFLDQALNEGDGVYRP